MKLAQQQLLNLLKVGAIICYLLLLLVHFDPKNIRSTNTSNIIDKLEYKMPVLGMVMVIIMFSLLIQTPMGAIICYLLLLLKRVSDIQFCIDTPSDNNLAGYHITNHITDMTNSL